MLFCPGSGPPTIVRLNASLLSTLNLRDIEPKWQAKWQQHQSRPSNLAMLLPPPNITGSLHCGHALTVAIQDTLVRWHALNGTPIHWISGTDHAGIATQSVVEKMLSKNNGPNRHTLGRDKFMDLVWSWKSQYGDLINHQLSNLGPYLHSMPYFTMDAARSRIVQDAFIALYDRGLIYRATRLVHWCPYLSSVISDIEVDKVQIDHPTTLKLPTGMHVTVGLLDIFKYRVVGGSQISVSTTRLETVLGDVALAVHPNDSRYAHLVHQFVEHPIIPGRRLPIVADAGVDPNFGTGVVKVSPAHDAFDFDLANKHNLGPAIDSFCPLGKICSNPLFPADLVGRDRFHARDMIRSKLTVLGLHEGSRSHAMRVPLCSRTSDIIEPRLVPQWYIRCKPMADKVLSHRSAIRVGSTYTSEISDEFFQMLENMHDWCISRQLWWGHRIPAYCQPTAQSNWVVSATNPGDKWVQDQDVLDTWFSSALLPISATNPGVDVFNPGHLVNYPTEILETGHDILLFWVARMAMVCTELTDQVPFRRVLVHGMVRDAEGRKMSKSLGNVIDPLDVIHGRSLPDLVSDLGRGNLPQTEISRSTKIMQKQFPTGIPACGADALRLSLLELASSRQINLDISKVITKHHFTNKLFNLSKFVLPYLTPNNPGSPINTLESIPEQWILHRLQHVYARWNSAMADGKIGTATQLVIDFILTDVSDTYIEFIKHGHQNLARHTLTTVMQYVLVLVHPMAPHVTAELYQQLFPTAPDLPHQQSLTELLTSEQQGVLLFEAIWKVIQTCRRRLDFSRPVVGVGPTVVVGTGDAALHEAMTLFQTEIFKLSRFHSMSGVRLEFVLGPRPDLGHHEEYCVEPELMIRVYKPAKYANQTTDHHKEISKISKQVHRIESMIESDTYAFKVPEPVRKRNLAKLITFRARLRELGPSDYGP